MDSRLTNNLRAELYKLLFPRIIEEDHRVGHEGVVHHWDDPVVKWDEGLLWDEMGFKPILKNIFFAIEQEETKDLEFIDGITDLVDPDKCPLKFLDIMARSLGYQLEEELSEKAQREVLKSIIPMYKSRGREVSWEIFYRMMGWQIDAIPLWKKNVFESNGDYHINRYKTEIVSETLSVLGSKEYSGIINGPIVPGSIRIKIGDIVLRDDQLGIIMGRGLVSGNINYVTGNYELIFNDITGFDLIVSYELILEEWPYRAARVDLEFYIYLEDKAKQYTFNQNVLSRLLSKIDEVRPIHVLVRVIVLVLDSPEILNDFATDAIKCGPRNAKDVREDEYRFYTGDLAPGVNEKELIVEKDFGVDKEQEILLNERTSLGRDRLQIDFSDDTPSQYW